MDRLQKTRLQEKEDKKGRGRHTRRLETVRGVSKEDVMRANPQFGRIKEKLGYDPLKPMPESERKRVNKKRPTPKPARKKKNRGALAGSLLDI
jgi:hypothetical protein